MVGGLSPLGALLGDDTEEQEREESEMGLTSRERVRFRRFGYTLLGLGFMLFMTGPPLYFLLAPPGSDLALGAALAIIAMGLLMFGGLMIAQGHSPTIKQKQVQGVNLSGGRQTLLDRAKHLIEAERLEEAAQIYEHLGMYKEAGELRRRARQQVVTHVEVNMNELIEEMRRGGLTTSYNCPSCGAATKISGSTAPGSLTHCTFCGAAFRTTDIAELLAQVTGNE